MLSAFLHILRPTYFVLAAEERSRYFKEAFIIPKPLQDKFDGFIISKHPYGIPGERPGLGSNLRFAIQTIRESVEPSVLQHALIHKIDGNALLPENHFHILEHEWRTLDPKAVFQTCVTECGYLTCIKDYLPFFTHIQ